MNKNNDGDVYAIISLVLGILSVIFSFGYLVFPCAFGIPAIILGNVGFERSEEKKSLAKAGKICGIIGIIFGVLWIITYVALFVIIFKISS